MKNYKNFLAVVLILGLFSLTSCKDDDPEPTTEELLIDGKWKLTKDKEYKNGELTDTYILDYDLFVNFNSDHTGRTEDSEDGTLEITNWIWSLEGDILSLTLDNYTETINLDRITQSQLIMYELEIDGQDEYKYVSVFER